MSSSNPGSPRSAHSGRSARSRRSGRSRRSSRSGRSSQPVEPTVFDHPLYRPSYVPYVEPRPAKMPTVVAILESKSRVYYKPPSEVLPENQKRRPISQPLILDTPLLDLGMEPLIKIVNEMHRMTSENSHYYFDQNASRAAGLQSYLDFVQGKPMKPRNSLESLFAELSSTRSGGGGGGSTRSNNTTGAHSVAKAQPNITTNRRSSALSIGSRSK